MGHPAGAPAPAATTGAPAAAAPAPGGAGAVAEPPVGGGAGESFKPDGAVTALPKAGVRKATLEDFILLKTVGKGSFGKVVMVSVV